MRRLAAAALASTLLLAGCAGQEEPEVGSTETPAADPSADPAAGPQPTAEDIAALEAVEVEGDLGEAPTLTFETPFTISAPVARMETEGDGAALEEGQQLSIHYVAFNGDTGEPLGQSTWETGTPQSLTLGDETIVTALTDVLSDAKVGSRVLFAAPGTEAIAATESTPELPATAATVMAIEIVDAKTVPTRAEGEAVEPPAGLPVVTLAQNGEPSIEVPADAEKPTELVAQTLIEGSGEPVEVGDQVTVHYKGWLWDGTEFDTSWNGEPFPTPIGAGQLIPAWDEGLVGKTVGSQVLIVAPPEMAYGAEGMGDIPPDSTLIFVVDILASS